MGDLFMNLLCLNSFWTMVGGTAWWKWIEACIFLGLDMTQVKKLSLE